jgi:hypothetical protein
MRWAKERSCARRTGIGYLSGIDEFDDLVAKIMDAGS